MAQFTFRTSQPNDTSATFDLPVSISVQLGCDAMKFYLALADVWDRLSLYGGPPIRLKKKATKCRIASRSSAQSDGVNCLLPEIFVPGLGLSSAVAVRLTAAGRCSKKQTFGVPVQSTARLSGSLPVTSKWRSVVLRVCSCSVRKNRSESSRRQCSRHFRSDRVPDRPIAWRAAIARPSMVSLRREANHIALGGKPGIELLTQVKDSLCLGGGVWAIDVVVRIVTQQERLIMRVLVMALILACASLANADPTIYKCERDGKITYSGTPCEGTTVKEIAPDKGSSAQNRAQVGMGLELVGAVTSGDVKKVSTLLCERSGCQSPRQERHNTTALGGGNRTKRPSLIC